MFDFKSMRPGMLSEMFSARAPKALSVLAMGCVLGSVLILSGCGALVSSAPNLSAHGSTSVTQPYPTGTVSPPVYTNPLTGSASGWATGQECTFKANGLAVQPSGGQAYICLAPTQPVSNVAITVTVQQTSGTGTHAYGIALRHNDPKSYYFFGIDTHGRYTLTTVVNDIGHTIIPFTVNAAIHKGLNASNTLEAIAQGNTLTLLVNGTAVGQANASTFSSGTVGLRGVNDGVVLFSQLTISQV